MPRYLYIRINSQRDRREYTKISRFATKFQLRMWRIAPNSRDMTLPNRDWQYTSADTRCSSLRSILYHTSCLVKVNTLHSSTCICKSIYIRLKMRMTHSSFYQVTCNDIYWLLLFYIFFSEKYIWEIYLYTILVAYIWSSNVQTIFI